MACRKGTFKNEAVILFGSKAEPDSTGDIPGLVITKDSASAVTFKRIVRGSRTAWSENKALGDKNSGFFKPADFRQGADVMPRTLVFHSLARASASSWSASPISTNSQENYLKADAKTHKSFALSVNGLSDSVIFDVLLSHHLSRSILVPAPRGYYLSRGKQARGGRCLPRRLPLRDKQPTTRSRVFCRIGGLSDSANLL